MGRHKNPQYNRKRLVVAGVAAVTTLGVAVGIGIYGNAFADQSNTAASQECLPAPPSVSVPATTTTTEAPPSETAPTEEPTDTETSSDTATDTGTDTASDTATDTATDEPTDTETSATDTSTSEDAPMDNYAADKLLSLNGHPGNGNGGRGNGGYGGGNNNGGHGQPPTQSSAPGDEGGPVPSETAPPVPPGDSMGQFPGGAQCQDALGPFPQDFVDIRKVRPSNVGQQSRRGGARNVFTVDCGTNKNGHGNSANMIAAPGNENGAQHTHDYVGNLTTDGFSTNESLAAGGTTCKNGDKSAYFWPIIRIRNKGSKAVDPLNAHNIGDPILPVSAKIEFRGNAAGPVVAAPQFLRVLTGNAKSVTQAGANQNAKWTCTGFENRITAKYPLCPRGSQTVRIADFPGCNDGNTDSANHRTHIAFADAQGKCPAGMKAIPQLRITLKYNLPRGKLFALDAFPDEKHSPITDHNDFVNVMGEQLMNQVVQCVNTGRRC
ncbi:DUF1996 domain-containing protein [Actinophytocola oryzae]|uniref:Uncharacterized protein DUF1996 n=1 Tax=Actinophytocola oryzae TaxID=502181 RepID=A0A4R7VY34_9PSEU|nr:DUF1996 domain-containing protein [Actinophytocola oryzae]TDV55070.1 uncharacterized protein DUF1996 [Actinophytocola oryzae]